MSTVKRRSEDLQRYRDDVEKQEREFTRTRRQREHEERRRLNDAEQAAVKAANASAQHWEWIDQRITSAITVERAFMNGVIGEAIASLIREESSVLTTMFKAQLAEHKLDVANKMLDLLAKSERSPASIANPRMTSADRRRSSSPARSLVVKPPIRQTRCRGGAT
jgi:hypothetical protein